MLSVAKFRVWGVVLVGVLAYCSTGHAADLAERIAQGQRLRIDGRTEEARAQFLALLQESKSYAPDDKLEAVLLDNLALCEESTGDYTKAESTLNHALSVLHPDNPCDPIMAKVKTHLAELYIQELRPAEAEPLLRQAAAAWRDGETESPVALAIAYNDLAAAYVMQRKFPEAETTLRQSLALLDTQADPEDPAIASTLLTYAGFLIRKHQYADAVAPTERAWKILRDNPNSVAPTYMASAYAVISLVYRYAGRMAEAADFAHKSVDLAEKGYGTGSSQVAGYLTNYANILKQTDQKKLAREVQKRADAMSAENSASAGGYTVNVNALR